MKPICKNCKHFFSHLQNNHRQGFCRRWNSVTASDEMNENCFLPTKEVENHHRNLKKMDELGLTLQDLPRTNKKDGVDIAEWLRKKQEKKCQWLKQQEMLERQLDLFN